MRTILGLLGRIPRPTPAMGVALLALVVAASGAAVAAIPSSDGTITACRDNRSGALKVIDAQTQNCSSKEQALSWRNGLPGSTVANADKLDAKSSEDFLASNGTAANSELLDGKEASDFALAGSSALPTIYTRTFAVSTNGNGGENGITAACFANGATNQFDQVLAGGIKLNDSTNQKIVQSLPSNDPNDKGWVARVKDDKPSVDGPAGYVVTILCADTVQ